MFGFMNDPFRRTIPATFRLSPLERWSTEVIHSNSVSIDFLLVSFFSLYFLWACLFYFIAKFFLFFGFYSSRLCFFSLTFFSNISFRYGFGSMFLFIFIIICSFAFLDIFLDDEFSWNLISFFFILQLDRTEGKLVLSKQL